MTLTPPNMILFPRPFAEVPNQPCNPMLASANPVNSAAKMDQLAQPEAQEARSYGKKFEVWTYGLFHVGQMSAKVRVSCVYNYPPWGIHQITTNELATLWDIPLLFQDKLEELDKISLLVQLFCQFREKRCFL